jgi:hypothetical protein
MRQKDTHLSLLGSNPKLPGKRSDPYDNFSEGGKWRPLVSILRRWKHRLSPRQRPTAEPTVEERVEIEAQVSQELYPKRFKR